MSEKYKIIVEREGVNHVKVFKSEGDGYTNHWNFPLKGDDNSIVFSEFYTETKFIVMNWDGWIRIYDAAAKELLFDHNLNGKIDAKAILSLDKSKLYIALCNASYENVLFHLSLDTFAIEGFGLPDIYDSNIHIRKDGNLLFYKHESKRVDRKEVYHHFFTVLDVTTHKLESYNLPFVPQSSFIEFKPVIDLEKNSVIMPAYNEVTSRITETRETVFEFKIVVLDLNTFEILALLSVRDFPQNQLDCNEYSSNSMAELFLDSDRDDDYWEAVSEYYENLNTIKIVPDGMWLCWRGGIIRKINHDFSMSPLLVTDTRPLNSEKGMFNHSYFHSHLFHIDHSTIVLAEALNFYKAPMPPIVNADSQIPIALQFEETSREELYNINYSDEQKQEIENRDYIKIEVTDLSTKESILDALSQMQTIVSDLNAAGIGSILLFEITDSKGKTWKEPEFFEEAIKHEPERIQTVIATLIQYPKVKYLYRNDEETALCHAVLELAKQGDLFITTVFQYLDAIDLDHDVFNVENLFPLLEESYTSKELTQKMKAVSEDLAEWYDYYCEG